MSSIEELIKSPVADDDSIMRLLIMTGLTVLSFLILPLFILAGYYAKTANHRGEGLPPVEDYLDLFLTGLKVWAGKLAVFTVFLLLVATVGALEAFIGEALSDLLVVTSLLVLLYIPAMTVGIGKRGRFRDGFSREIASRSLTLDYLKALVALLALRILMVIVSFVLVLTFLGIILIPAVQAYRKLIAWRIVGDLLDL